MQGTDTGTSTAIGSIVGSLIVFPLIVYGIAYLIIRIIKKRSPTRRETIVILAIAFGLAVLSAAGRAGRQ